MLSQAVSVHSGWSGCMQLRRSINGILPGKRLVAGKQCPSRSQVIFISLVGGKQLASLQGFSGKCPPYHHFSQVAAVNWSSYATGAIESLEYWAVLL